MENLKGFRTIKYSHKVTLYLDYEKVIGSDVVKGWDNCILSWLNEDDSINDSHFIIEREFYLDTDVDMMHPDNRIYKYFNHIPGVGRIIVKRIIDGAEVEYILNGKGEWIRKVINKG